MHGRAHSRVGTFFDEWHLRQITRGVTRPIQLVVAAVIYARGERAPISAAPPPNQTWQIAPERGNLNQGARFCSRVCVKAARRRSHRTESEISCSTNKTTPLGPRLMTNNNFLPARSLALSCAIFTILFLHSPEGRKNCYVLARACACVCKEGKGESWALDSRRQVFWICSRSIWIAGAKVSGCWSPPALSRPGPAWMGKLLCCPPLSPLRLLLLHAAVCFIISCLKQWQRRGRQLLLCTVRAARCLLLWKKAKWNSKQVGRDLFYHASKAICSNKNIRPRLPVLLTPWPEGTSASARFCSELKSDIFQTVAKFPRGFSLLYGYTLPKYK